MDHEHLLRTPSKCTERGSGGWKTRPPPRCLTPAALPLWATLKSRQKEKGSLSVKNVVMSMSLHLNTQTGKKENCEKREDLHDLGLVEKLHLGLENKNKAEG